MRTDRMATAVLIVFSALGLHVLDAQEAGTKRTDLQRHDLSAPGREVVQVRVDFDPGYVAPKHTHPGEEIIYVIEGVLEYDIGGTVSKVKAGDVLFVPAGQSTRRETSGVATEPNSRPTSWRRGNPSSQ